MQEEFRRKLEAEKERLVNELAQVGKLSPVRGEPLVPERIYGAQKEDDALLTVEWEKRLALEKSLRQQLEEVEHALGKFGSGKFGLCEECGQPIDPERLGALPQAQLCMTCKARRPRERGR